MRHLKNQLQGCPPNRVNSNLLNEATQQARYKQGFRTIGGAIPLGALGGDRVVLSPDLKSTLMNIGRIHPYRRSYAKRATTKSLAVSRPIPTHRARQLSGPASQQGM
jgi:hypothetical protein